MVIIIIYAVQVSYVDSVAAMMDLESLFFGGFVMNLSKLVNP